MDYLHSDMGKNIKQIGTDGECLVYLVKDETGEGKMTIYEIFDGVYVIYNDFHMERCWSEARPGEKFLGIDHCREGRIEWEINGKYQYSGPGDLKFYSENSHDCHFFFPLRHYHGVTITFSVERGKKVIPEIMGDYVIDPALLKLRFCPDNLPVEMHKDERIEHIFTEIYHLPDSIRIRYLRLKVLELLLLLDVVQLVPEQKKQYFRKNQVDKIKEMASFMKEHLEQRYTIEDLSMRFDFPVTSMKSCFKAVFGMSIYAYMKTYRMNAAAVLLKTTDKTIFEIASDVGYDNAGKFSAAFLSVMGMKPNEYRKSSVQMEHNLYKWSGIEKKNEL